MGSSSTHLCFRTPVVHSNLFYSLQKPPQQSLIRVFYKEPSITVLSITLVSSLRISKQLNEIHQADHWLGQSPSNVYFLSSSGCLSFQRYIGLLIFYCFNYIYLSSLRFLLKCVKVLCNYFPRSELCRNVYLHNSFVFLYLCMCVCAFYKWNIHSQLIQDIINVNIHPQVKEEAICIYVLDSLLVLFCSYITSDKHLNIFYFWDYNDTISLCTFLSPNSPIYLFSILALSILWPLF